MSLGQDCPVESAAPGGGSEPEQGLSLSARLLGLADAAPCPRDQVSTHVSIPAFGEPAGDTLVTRRLGEDHGGGGHPRRAEPLLLLRRSHDPDIQPSTASTELSH